MARLLPRGLPGLILVALAAVVVSAGWLYLRLAGPRNIRNVLLISIDTCRADHLSCYGYREQATPNVDALARDGVRFTSVVTPVPMTLPAHCSLLTGSYPATHGVRGNDGRLGDAKPTLARVMRSAGYQTAAIIGGFPMSSRFGIGQGFDTYDDQFPPVQRVGEIAERKAEEVSRRGMAWLQSRGGQPFFLFLHYYDPHFPYDPPPPFPASYDGELAYTDLWIGKVFDKLRDLGLYDNTLVVLVGDHGESLSEHGEKEHGFLIYQSTLRVPMIVRAPGGPSGASVDENASLIDVVPTVLGLTHLRLSQPLEGADLSGYLNGVGRKPSPRPLFSESLWPESYGCCPLYGVVEGSWKYIRARTPELYDLGGDAEEKDNLVDKRPELARGLSGRLDQWRQAMAAAQPQSNRGAALSQDTLEQLESLGYVGGGGGAESRSDLKREDPKDFVTVYEHYRQGMELMWRRRYEEAEKELQWVVSKRRKFVAGHFLLGEAETAQLHGAAAAGEFSTALSLLARSKDAPVAAAGEANRKQAVRCHVRLGHALVLDGKPDEAIREYQAALEMEPGALERRDHFELVNLLAAQGRFAEAVARCRNVPADPWLRNKLAWMLATLPDASIRNGAEALAIARELAQGHRAGDPVFLTTLAAAYAETGQFRQATATAQKALALAKSARNTLLARELQSQLDLYRADCPCRAAPQMPER